MTDYDYKVTAHTLKNLLDDLLILAGDEIGPSDVSWQDVAGTAAFNARALANLLDAARTNNVDSIVFPSPNWIIEV